MTYIKLSFRFEFLNSSVDIHLVSILESNYKSVREPVKYLLTQPIYRQRYGNDISVPYKPIKEEPTIPQVVPSDYRKPAADNPAPRKSKRRVERKSAEADNNLAKVEPPHKESDVQVPNRVENDKPVFKVQLLVSSNVLKSDDNRFKGLTNIESYKEGLYKYTYGASTNYNE